MARYVFLFIITCFATNILTILHFPHQKPLRPLSLTPQPQQCRPIYSASLSDINLKLSEMIDLNALYNFIKPFFITILLKSSLFPTIPLYLPQNLIFRQNLFFLAPKGEVIALSNFASLPASIPTLTLLLHLLTISHSSSQNFEKVDLRSP